MKKILLSFLIVLATASIASPDEWKQYYKDSNSRGYYQDLKKMGGSIVEVNDSLQIGGACVMNIYQIDCKSKKFKQIKSGAGPCDRDINLKAGDPNWFPLDKEYTDVKRMKKLMGVACKSN